MDHHVTREEFDATMAALHRRIGRLQADLDELRLAAKAGRLGEPIACVGCVPRCLECQEAPAG